MVVQAINRGRSMAILLRRKYTGSKVLSQINWKPRDSHFWAGLMYAKKYFFRHGSFLIKDGSEIRFREDSWLGNLPLKDQYPALYSIAHNKSDTIAEVLNTSPPNVTFRQDLIGERLASWHALQEQLANVQLTDKHDEFRWNLIENRIFLVDSMYKVLLHSEAPIHKNKYTWKMKIPLRIKVFAWYLRRGVILTKDNLVRRNWQGSPKCCFCHHDETIKHLFFQCQFVCSIWLAIQVASSLSPPRSSNIFGNWLYGIDNRDRVHIRVGAIALIWSLWLCRNNMVFDAKMSSPMQVIYHCAHLLREWSTLQKPEHRGLYMEVCSRLEQVAKDVFTQYGWQHRLRINHLYHRRL
jgi:hypothetical protein